MELGSLSLGRGEQQRLLDVTYTPEAPAGRPAAAASLLSDLPPLGPLPTRGTARLQPAWAVFEKFLYKPGTLKQSYKNLIENVPKKYLFYKRYHDKSLLRSQNGLI